MTPIRITFDRSKCIAAKSCVSADPNTFGFDDTAQKAILRHGTPAGNDLFSRVIEGDDPMIRRAMDAAASCPVNAFKVENVSSGD
ncbi:MAG: ferredoxin, partial [archaeon]|nr:ferredoxin [archaeon]